MATNNMAVEIASERLVMSFIDVDGNKVDISLNKPDSDGIKSAIMAQHKLQLEKLVDSGIYGTTTTGTMGIASVSGLRFEIRSVEELDLDAE
ncbi:hypothetical protein AN644_04540 [Candidatus Epulonipiscium fishelsonii]|nr:hypothetical protein AN644_04540 [Epulopiscium sp. SCG-C06WGA-EpuloA1]